jgi:hypothetical protein
LHNNQVNAIVEFVLLFSLQALAQKREGGAIRVAAIAMQPKVTHDRRRQAPPRIRQAKHMQLAERDLPTRKDTRKQR